MPAQVSQERPDRTYVFRGPLVRRLTAEQFADSVSVATGQWRTIPQGQATHSRSRLGTEVIVVDAGLRTAGSRPGFHHARQSRDHVSSARTGQRRDADQHLQRGSLRLLGELPPAPVNLFDSGAMNKGTAAFDIDISHARELWLLTQDAGSYDPKPHHRRLVGCRAQRAERHCEAEGPDDALALRRGFAAGRGGRLREGNCGATRRAIVLSDSRLLVITRMRGRVVVDDRSRPVDIGGNVRFFVFDAKPDPSAW